MLIVVAIGGNAILKKDEKPSVDGQLANMRRTCRQLASMARKHHIVMTHGNGPQVGNILVRVEEALGKAYPLPLYACVAESQGEIGFMLEQSLQNELKHARVGKHVVTILTQTIIDPKDKSMKKPTKFVGSYYTKQEAGMLSKKGIRMSKDPRGGYRRVVPSPRPIEIVEADTIKKLVRSNIIVVAAGGGGIPVMKRGQKLTGIDAVIDKDMASACLARSISADILLILTDVDHASIDYRKPTQRSIGRIKVADLKKLFKAGHFPAGSMGPKVEACIEFIENGGRMAVITSPENAQKALTGKVGTVVV